MVQTQAQRTLLKSMPELFAELSDPAALERHLGEFAGQLRITAVKDDSSVRWEGQRAEGEVLLSAAGFGTKVSLTVREHEQPPPSPAPVVAPTPAAKLSLWARLLGRRQAPVAPVDVAPPPVSESRRDADELLAGVLDRLGAAHHRPFSRD